MILVCILAVPGFLYYLLTVGGKNRYKSLQYFGPKHLSGTFHKFHGEKIPDTVYHTLPEFELINQSGAIVTSKEFDKKIFVVNFFYSRCPDICNQIHGNVKRLADKYAKNKMVKFVSITVDPLRDRPKTLKSYAAQYKADPNNWHFLTGDTTGVYNLARKGFLVNTLKGDDGNFIFSDKLILIDAEKRIRGYYAGTSDTDVNRLYNEIKVQIAEELRKIKAPR
ncbi:SCO family protein [Mucilaginibacter hurinus]|nr:SCO family protein [Mucilaginibacter hurinus]